ncbi:unnamed protein product [Miscanthus lutarioriparius]|uniref:Endonuclease/exonuclease/phosphatase domain-containing protein n=1 Tax=Miscanthus lutarioriparius TaxID=422564 RepID=A0A811MEF0_9POAL|nr:unnamed protein product [Miscanthus lutarioriparius]
MPFSLLRTFCALKPSPLPLPLPFPLPRRVATSPCRAMSSATNLRLLSWDCADDPLDFGAFAGAVFLPLQRRAAKREPAVSPEAVQARAVDERGGGAAEEEEKAPAAKKGNSNHHSDKKTVKIMTYNVWFREELELIRRMNAIGDLIQHHSPDLICFQEVTPNIYLLFEKSDWWQAYKCSLPHEMAMQRPYYSMQMSKLPVKSFDRKPFYNSKMGRELCIADVTVGGVIKLVVATSHLESPSPGPPTWDQMFSKERVGQANESVRTLGAFRNLQKRLDRFVCKLSDFKVESIEMIGEEVIPGVTYIKEKKVRQEICQLVLPVLPSDHFGLVLTISSQSEKI